MDGKLDLRFPEPVAQRIREAARLLGQTLTEFATDAVLDRAEDVLRQSDGDAMTEFLAGAPEDDEPYSQDEQKADVEAWARYQKEDGVTPSSWRPARRSMQFVRD